MTKQNTQDTMTVKQGAALVAEACNIDATKAGKLYRSFIRRNDEKLRDMFAWPPEEKQRADGNRYTPQPQECADYIVAALTRDKSDGDS